VQAPSAAQAMSLDSQRMWTVVAARLALGIPRTQIQTEGYSLYPNTDTRGRIVSFSVDDTLLVETSHLSLVGPMLGAAVSHGANMVESVQFGVANPSSLERQTQVLALDDARAQARRRFSVWACS
jgi:uncharacterized protein YggE